MLKKSTLLATVASIFLWVCLVAVPQSVAQPLQDAKNRKTGDPEPVQDPVLHQYGIYAKTAARAPATKPIPTQLPLELKPGAKIAMIGNMLLERSQNFGQLESLLHQRYPNHNLVVRHLGWPADTAALQPRPDNFADTEQHLFHEKADVIIVALGFNESFEGPAGIKKFAATTTQYLKKLQSSAYNGTSGPQIIVLSPIANENLPGIPAADLNNQSIELYGQKLREITEELKVGFVDLYSPTQQAMNGSDYDLTINGVHLNEHGYSLFANLVYKRLFGETAPDVRNEIQKVVVDKNRQFFRRFRPLNTFYYTGGRSKTYGYLDFLPAMRNFEVMVANRDQRIWDLAQHKIVPDKIDDSNLPLMPDTKQSRGANQWMSAADELKAFKIDERFEVNLFAGEEQFPDIAAPIQMRWDNRGRLWVSCSTTYPHVYPGNEPNDQLVILEDVDGDGKADKSTVFADDLHIPLSFEFGDGGVYVSEEPHLTFLKDTDGDGKADYRRRVLSGFGTEDSHHSLHDFAWTPDGDLIFRESIFHHSQVETAYGPIRQQNSGWFRFDPPTQRLTSFGTYHSTNPWGVTFDDWGQHVASHPVFAAAFHSLDPPYPSQHPKPAGLQAYSGTCGQEFVDFGTFPGELQGGFIKARYKPTNRIEIHKWVEGEFGFDEEYVSDLIFSKNLSFIPVDIRFGPRGALYVCDWYNPVKGHAQYSLRDERRDRHSGRIWRITEKGKPLQDPPAIADASIDQLLQQLKRPESRIRYWIRRELRLRASNPAQREVVRTALDVFTKSLSPGDSRYRHHQLEALWVYRGIDYVNVDLLRELLKSENKQSRAAATEQLRFWHTHLDDSIELLRRAANDSYSMVRMQAAITASYIGTQEAFVAMKDVLKHPMGDHLAYAVTCALGSHTLRPYWENDKNSSVAKLLRDAKAESSLREPTPGAQHAQFDSQPNLTKIQISCLPEVMQFDKTQIAVTVGQPVKIVFMNPDATDHNFVIVKPGALADVGMAANEMAKDPKNANSDFIPAKMKTMILHASKMIGPTRAARVHVLRFNAPTEPGIYPYVCTFPGHWVVMNGIMVVANDLADVDQMVADSQPKIVQEWTMADFPNLAVVNPNDENVMRGMQVFAKARCNQCHVLAGHGVNLGPDLKEVTKKYKNEKLLAQLLEPSSEINEKYQTYKFLLTDGQTISGVIVNDSKKYYDVMTNLLTPKQLTRIEKEAIEIKAKSKISAMPEGMLDVLTRAEIGDLMTFLQSDGYQLPKHLQKMHGHGSMK
ncbi:MAG: putative heme-binding domain-containing protein [Mariniblastus sp.]|jgi:putative heme-binding domain-containing protein